MGDDIDMGGDFRQSRNYVKSPHEEHQHHYYAPVERVEIDEDAARARLSELPIDTPPPVSALPPCSRMPFTAHPGFVGRDDELTTLARILKGGETTAVGKIAAASGLGGIGKTQLAAEFAHRYGTYFQGGVYWLSFAEPEAVEAQIANCGGPEGMGLMPGFNNLAQPDQVAMVQAEWQRNIPRLLIFDNCEDTELLRRYRPVSGAARVLMTSRRTEWPPSSAISPVTLGVLDRPESVALLRHFRPELSAGDATLAAIAETLGDLPLALYLAGSFLRRYRHDDFGQPQAYLDALNRSDLLSHLSLVAAEDSPTEHDPNVARTFALSYERLDARHDTDPIALALLARAACFAPGEPIPRELLLKTWGPENSPDPPSAMTASDALRRLSDLGLLAVEENGNLLLHRLLAVFVRDTAPEYTAAREGVEETLAKEARFINGSGLPAALAEWRMHLEAVTDHAQHRNSPWASRLLSSLGYYLQSVAEFQSARQAFERALTIDEAAYGEDHPNVATIVNNLGNVLRDLGDLSGAQKAYERALAIDEAAYGKDHPNVARDVNNLGSLLRALGDFSGARQAFERALTIDEAAYGEDHPNVATIVNNLGGVLHDLGDLSGAQQAYERALAIHEAAYGKAHPKVAIDVNNLGGVLKALSDLSGARKAYERALAINEAAYGKDHPNVAIIVNNLGGVLHDLGDLSDAKKAYERALAIDEAAYGKDHPNVAIRVSNLGSVLRALGDLTGATQAFERALSIEEAAYSEDHPEVATIVNNLGGVLHDLDDLSGAQKAYERALAIHEAAYGNDHSEVARDVNNLGGVLQDLGDLSGARQAYERAVDIFEKTLGPNHPSTQLVTRNLEGLGNCHGAIGRMRRAWAKFAKR